MQKILKLSLIILLLGCLLNFHYGYYQFVRFAALVGFGYLAYNANDKGFKNEAFVYLVLAILFQPFIKIALGRTIWNIVDVLVASGLLLSILKFSKNKLDQNN
jgi:hypothetical protein